jgi:hypothetical protein
MLAATLKTEGDAPKSVPPVAKKTLAEIRDAEEKDHARDAARAFDTNFRPERPKAAAKAGDDLDELLALIRLPGRALGAPEDLEPDRVDVLHRPPADPGHEGVRLTCRRPGDAVRADRGRRAPLAVGERATSGHSGPSRRRVPQGEAGRLGSSGGVIGSAEEFVRLRTSEDPSEYNRAAHEELSEELCADIIERFPEMRFWVAQNKTVPLSVLRVLATDPDEVVRSMVAMKRKLDHALMEVLSKDPYDAIRAQIARRTNAPLEIVRRLAKDENVYVRTTALDALENREGRHV